MADEKKTEEESTEETKDALNSAIEAGDEKEAEDKEEKHLEAMKEFDSLIDSEDDDSADEETDDDGEEKDDPAKEEVKEPAEKAAEEEVPEPGSIDAAADALEKEIEAEATKSDEQKATEKAEADAKAAKEAEDAKKSEEEPYDCGLNTDLEAEGEAYEPALVEALNKQGQAVQDRAKDAEAKNTALESRLDRQEAERTADWLDEKFNSLGENFTEAVGFGEFQDFDSGSVEQENRLAISKRMQVTAKACVRDGKPIPSRNKLFDMAVKRILTKETNKPETDKETANNLAKRSKQTIGRASKKGTALSKAKSNLQKQKEFDALLD